MDWGTFYGILFGGLVVVLLLCFLCCRFPVLSIMFMLCGCVALIVLSFTMPVELNENGHLILNWNYIVGQGLCIFLTVVCGAAEWAFMEDGQGNSMVWALIASGLATAGILLLLNYLIFDSAIALGVVGCLFGGWIVIMVVRRTRNS